MPIGDGSRNVRACCAVVFGAMAVMASGGAGAAQVAYERLIKAQAMFDALPPGQRDKVALKVLVVHENAADTSPIRMMVSFAGKTTAFGTPVGHGVVLPPLRPDMVAGHAMVETGQVANSLREEIDIIIAVPARQPISVRYLLDAVQQAQEVLRAGARQMAGMLAVFVTPKVHGVVVGLTHCCGEVVVLQADDRRQSFTQDAKGDVVLSLSVLEGFDGGTLAASVPVVTIDPDVD